MTAMIAILTTVRPSLSNPVLPKFYQAGHHKNTPSYHTLLYHTALAHTIYGIQCYQCVGVAVSSADEEKEPCFNPSFNGIEVQECPSAVKSCLKLYIMHGDIRKY